MNKEAAQMHALFRGNENAYGTFRTGEKEESGKLRGQSLTIPKPVTDELWLKHLKGEKAIGIVPLDDEDKCRWGCIDVDDYPAKVKETLTNIQRHKLPLIACFSKSRGLHLFLFLNRPFPAKHVSDCLQTMAGLLGLGGKEIFPKQIHRAAVGNWLNMPYHGNTRRCITEKGELTLEAFLDFITPLDSLPKVGTIKSVKFPDGPPCLQAIAESGPVGEHEKHNALLAMSVYFKLAKKDDWPDQLRIANLDTTLLPQGSKNIEELIENLKGSPNYNYPCNTQPIQAHCQRALCMTRRFGVNNGACMPVHRHSIGDGHTSIHFITVYSKGKEYELKITSEQWLDPKKFALACFEQIFNRPPSMTYTQWAETTNVTPATEEATTHSYYDNKFDDLTQYLSRNKTDERSDLLTNDKMAWFDMRHNRVVFKAASLAKVLNVPAAIVERMIRSNGGDMSQIGFPGNINRRFNWLPIAVVLEKLPVPAVPEDEEDPI